MKTFKKNMIYGCCVNLCLAFTLIVFGPLEIFISNISDFRFGLSDFWWMLSALALGYLIISTVFIALLPDKLCEIITSLIFAFTLCCYIQTMFLNRKMQVLIGQEVGWEKKTIIFNLFIWMCIFIIVFAVKYYLKDKGRKVIKFISLSLVAVQLVALISLLLTTDALFGENKNYGYVSTEGMLELSQEKNVIVFILDYFDGRYMDSILAENEDFLLPLKGFTYYPDATSVHSRTYPSITYLLTGNMCYFDKEPHDYVNEAYEDSSFLPDLYENGIEIGLYTYPNYIGDSMKPKICNYAFKSLPLNFKEVIKSFMKIALYRDMPYLVKARFQYDAADINNRVIKYDSDDKKSDENAAPFQLFNDAWFAQMLTENGISIGEQDGCFRFYHLASVHADFSDWYSCAVRSFEIINEYADKMRELGIYEDSTIIITADHGYHGGGGLDLPQKTAVPILFVKPAGASDEDFKVSDAPVSHTEFIPTILNGFSLDYQDYGRTVYDIGETEDRERFYYYSAVYTHEYGEIELREYKVDGDARNEENYHYTGKKWDILYSENPVSPK
ncbi:MAG: sulfatase-like hydrolase/transferase [Lachnospiraceae bacterium]|nr:sulfatase-like hydrolase/transferase [Lachnospiraceae bacterium]